jgi:hypothetical protein
MNERIDLNNPKERIGFASGVFQLENGKPAQQPQDQERLPPTVGQMIIPITSRGLEMYAILEGSKVRSEILTQELGFERIANVCTTIRDYIKTLKQKLAQVLESKPELQTEITHLNNHIGLLERNLQNMNLVTRENLDLNSNLISYYLQSLYADFYCLYEMFRDKPTVSPILYNDIKEVNDAIIKAL